MQQRMEMKLLILLASSIGIASSAAPYYVQKPLPVPVHPAYQPPYPFGYHPPPPPPPPPVFVPPVFQPVFPAHKPYAPPSPPPVYSASKHYVPPTKGYEVGGDKNAAILNSYYNYNPVDFSFEYGFETDNGITSEAKGHLGQSGGQIITGSFSSFTADGKPVKVTYTADENGYVPSREGIPSQSPVPTTPQNNNYKTYSSQNKLNVI